MYIYIFQGPVNSMCIGSQKKEKTRKDYRLRTKSKNKRKKLLILYNSPHKFHGNSIDIDKTKKRMKTNNEQSVCLRIYITFYYFEKLINSICCFLDVEWCKAEDRKTNRTQAWKRQRITINYERKKRIKRNSKGNKNRKKENKHHTLYKKR